MTLNELLSALVRRRRLFLLTLVLCLGVTAAATFALPKTYRAKAVLSVEQGEGVQAFDASSIEQLTRTYATLAGNPNVVDAVRTRLPERASRSEVLDKMSFTPVERTQLLEIAADDRSPRKAQLLANTYASTFAERLSERAATGPSQGAVSVSEPAARPTRAVKPNPPLYIGFGTLLSLVLAFAAVVVRERLDQRVHVEPDDDVVLGQPVLGRIPQRDRRGRNELEFEDAFRVLKTNMEFASDAPIRTVAVTSPAPVEGKTSIASNLAVALVTGGQRVVFVEGDLRRPGLESAIAWQHAERSGVGLASFLVGAAELDEIITRQVTGLHVIWAGPVVPTPSSVLLPDRLMRLMATLSARYDRVVIDTPPVSVGADASIVGSYTDGALYVIDMERTRSPAARAGLNQLRKANVKVLGVVLNRAETPSLGGYYAPRGAFTAPAAGDRASAPLDAEG